MVGGRLDELAAIGVATLIERRVDVLLELGDLISIGSPNLLDRHRQPRPCAGLVRQAGHVHATLLGDRQVGMENGGDVREIRGDMGRSTYLGNRQVGVGIPTKEGPITMPRVVCSRSHPCALSPVLTVLAHQALGRLGDEEMYAHPHRRCGRGALPLARDCHGEAHATVRGGRLGQK